MSLGLPAGLAARGVDRHGQADELLAHDADIVVADLAELLDQA
jgi:phosphoglycolate phosphatase-like HAD superfamily hydrolase